MRHVLTKEAIVTCEARGHRFAWVPTWGDCGFEECRVCGETRRYGRKWSELEEVMALAAQIEASQRSAMGRAAMSVADAIDQKLMATLSLGADGMRVVVGRPPRNADRDASILADLAAGQRPSDVAAKWGVHPSRISQIKKAASAVAEP